jgi:hypothetical protein
MNRSEGIRLLSLRFTNPSLARWQPTAYCSLPLRYALDQAATGAVEQWREPRFEAPAIRAIKRGPMLRQCMVRIIFICC